MRKIALSLIFICACQFSFGQNEGRVGVFTGLYNASLLNANDQSWGDYLTTYKSMVGVEGSYYITIGHSVPVGITAQVGSWGAGQNYKGIFADGSYYEAYADLNYVRAGIGLNVSTNLRRRVAARLFGGVNFGVLNNYSDRFEYFGVDAARSIIDINDDIAAYTDEGVTRYGTLDEKLYNPVEMSVFYGVGADIKLKDYLILSIVGRFDLGLGNIENENNKKVSFPNPDGDAEVIDYPGYTTVVKYRGAVPEDIIRQPTVNQTYGVFLGLSYRLYNKAEHDIYYRKNW